MNAKSVLQDWVIDAVKAQGGTAQLLDVCKYIWKHHESDLRASGDMFFTWQYDTRWAAQKLRDAGKLEPLNNDRRGLWRLKRP